MRVAIEERAVPYCGSAIAASMRGICPAQWVSDAGQHGVLNYDFGWRRAVMGAALDGVSQPCDSNSLKSIVAALAREM